MATNKKLWFLSLLLLVLWATPVSAAVALNNASNNGANNGGSTNTVSWTFDAVGAGCTSCALLVQIEGDSAADDVTSVTYNAVAMTFLNKAYGGGTGRYTYTYGLLNPASGANTILATSTTVHYLFGNAISYSGVLGFGNTSSTACTASQQCTGNITVSTLNSWVYAGAAGSLVGTWSGVSNAVFRGYYQPFSSPSQWDNNTAVGTGAYAMTIDSGALGDIGMVMVELKATAGGGATAPKRVLLLGVGGDE